MDQEFFSEREFLKQVADAFQTLYVEYKKKNAIKVSVSMPPRAGKSYITSLFCCWWLGKFPHVSVMRNSATARLYNKFSYDCRAIIRSKRYKNVFPDVELAPDKQNLEGWNLTTAKQVSYFGAGVGGAIIGFGANLAITDDLFKDMAAALSETQRESVKMWKESAHNSRMETNCPEIFIGTRWSKNDIIGEAISSGKIDIEVKIPALTKDDKSFCEAVKTTAEYHAIRKEIDESIWDAEYMQEPGEVKGLLFPKDSLRYFQPGDISNLAVDFKAMAVDPADTGDSTSAPVGYLIGDNVYIVNALYNNHGTDVMIPELVEETIKRKLDHVEIEGQSAWILYAKQYRSLVYERYEDLEIRVVKAHTNKAVRIMHASAFIKNHFVFLHEDYWTPEYRKFMKVLTSYMRDGSTKRDDAPDSLTILAKFYQTTFPELWHISR